LREKKGPRTRISLSFPFTTTMKTERRLSGMWLSRSRRSMLFIAFLFQNVAAYQGLAVNRLKRRRPSTSFVGHPTITLTTEPSFGSSELFVSFIVPPPSTCQGDDLIEHRRKGRLSSTSASTICYPQPLQGIFQRKEEKQVHHQIIQEESEASPLAEQVRTSSWQDLKELLLKKRKREWETKYTSVDALRETYGSNQNKLWGDLQAGTARRLYKTLLPRALGELNRLTKHLQPEDLAPLAYQARVAVKLYTRERCTVPARLGATLFDGFRQWIRYGKFQTHGMSYDQLWQKYAEQIIREAEVGVDLSPRVCQKILERASYTNECVDQLVLSSPASSSQKESSKDHLFTSIHSQLEQDIFQTLLRSTTPSNRQAMWEEGGIWHNEYHFRTLRIAATARRLLPPRSPKQRIRSRMLEGNFSSE